MTTLTPARIAELLAMCEAATGDVRALPMEYDDGSQGDDQDWMVGHPGGSVIGDISKVDAEFFVAAITALPEALREIKRLSDERDVAQKEVERLVGELHETFIDDYGTVWNRPTSWAYCMVCRSENLQRQRAKLAEDERDAAQEALAKVTAERDADRKRYGELFDRTQGTPCAQIAWQQDREDLEAKLSACEAERDALREALVQADKYLEVDRNNFVVMGPMTLMGSIQRVRSTIQSALAKDPAP